jgi:hypothetical protein
MSLSRKIMLLGWDGLTINSTDNPEIMELYDPGMMGDHTVKNF